MVWDKSSYQWSSLAMDVLMSDWKGSIAFLTNSTRSSCKLCLISSWRALKSTGSLVVVCIVVIAAELSVFVALVVVGLPIVLVCVFSGGNCVGLSINWLGFTGAHPGVSEYFFLSTSVIVGMLAMSFFAKLSVELVVMIRSSQYGMLLSCTPLNCRCLGRWCLKRGSKFWSSHCHALDTLLFVVMIIILLPVCVCSM